MPSCPDRRERSALQQAVERFERGELDAADEACEQLLAERPDDVEGHRLRGAIACELGRLGDAARHFGRALAIDPERVELRLALGRLLREQGDLEGADAMLREARARSPKLGKAAFEHGRLCSERGDLDGAIEAYGQASLDASLAERAHHNLGAVLRRAGRPSEAARAFERALCLRPTSCASLRGLARALYACGRWDEAAGVFARLGDLDPQDEEAQHMAAALSGRGSEGCPAGYVRGLFDDHAARFDERLVAELGYRTHLHVAERVRAHRPPQGHARCLDLGCGTGLVGAEVRADVGWLTGVDLSAGMLERARERGVYDEIHCDGLPDWLERADARWSLVVAADVLPYFGRLERLFGGLRRVTERGAWVVVSIEKGVGEPFALGRSGRFAHDPEYVWETARQSSLDLVERIELPLRREGDHEVIGTLLVWTTT